MTIKAIFSDMDGTLLNAAHEISPRTRNAIVALSERGVRFVLVSGRAPDAMTSYQRLLPPAEMISNNGTMVHDSTGAMIHSVTLADSQLAAVRAEFAGHDELILNFYPGLKWYCEQCTHPHTRQEMDITGMTPEPVPQALHDVNKIMVRGEVGDIEAWQTRLREHFPELSITISQPGFLEILSGDAGKEKMAAWLSKYYGLTQGQTMACGDNFNDLEMIRWAGVGVAMANASDAVKAVADRIAGHHDRDGLAEVLESLL